MRPPRSLCTYRRKLFQLARLFVWQMLTHTHTRREKWRVRWRSTHWAILLISNSKLVYLLFRCLHFTFSIIRLHILIVFFLLVNITIYRCVLWMNVNCAFQRTYRLHIWTNFIFRSFIPVLIRPLRSDDFVQNSTNHSTKTWQYFFLFVVCHIEQHNYGISPHFQAMHVSIEQTYCTFCHLAIKTKHAKRERAKCSLWWFYAVPYK